MFLLLPISHCRCNCVITTLFLGSNFRNIFEGFHLYCKFIPSNVLQGHLTGKKCVWTQSIKPLLMSGFCRMKWLGVWMLAFWGRFKEAFTYLYLPFSITSSRRGSRGGETGEFSPPFFWALFFLFFFLIPQILIGSNTVIITKIHPPFQNPGSAPVFVTIT